MFGEVIKLRELARLLKKQRFEAALELARDPDIAAHRRAREAVDEARTRLFERARQRREEGELDLALRDVRWLLKDAREPRVLREERALLEALDHEEERAQAWTREKEKARFEADQGEFEKAVRRLRPLAAHDAGGAALLKQVEEDQARQASRHKELQQALKAGQLNEALEIMAKWPASTSSDELRLADVQLLQLALGRGDAALGARLFVAARRRHREAWKPPGDLLERLGKELLAAARREICGGEASQGAALLELFPLGSAADREAARLGRVTRRLARAASLLQEGELCLAQEQAEEALALEKSCKAAKRLLAEIQSRGRKAQKPLARGRELLARGELKKARLELAALLEELPDLSEGRELLAAVEAQEEQDLAALQACRQQIAAGGLREARQALLALELRRPDLEEVSVLRRDVRRRLKEGRQREFAEESLRLAAKPACGRPPAQGENASLPRAPGEKLPPGKPFILRVEERGDWFVHPGRTLLLGNSMSGLADLPILAAIGSRHARILRQTSRGGVRYRLDPGPGKRVTRNQRLLTEAAELRHGDVFSLGEVATFTFLRPIAENGSAVLTLHGNFQIHGCNRVLLFCEEEGEGGALVIGPGPRAHVPLGIDRDRVELLREEASQGGRLLARCPYGINVEGGAERPQVEVPLAARLHTLDVDFFADPL